MKSKTGFLVFLGGVIMAGNGFAASLATPEMLSNACAGCHGTNGVSAGQSIPTIAGIDAEYFATAMQGYKKGEWTSTVMGRLAKGYNDSEIAAMGNFFSRQRFIPADQKVDSAKAKLGESLHKQYCEQCHENNGELSSGTSGVLAGQWLPYLQATMTDYITGNRPMGKKMKSKIDAILSEHKDAGIEALINFYGSKK